ncbi:hypothetical protein H5410_063970 [Solanum commersonii]|uniref:Uncharacterized protein n=1 Tax=Solanum commersonii TaxID=4109 RepID=A0A9J5W0R8_SOLCO|nr:hypothetical protein H5410_063970 [Solanum commersonii]
MSRRLILQQARGQSPAPPTAAQSLRFHVLFHSRWGFFSPFPHGCSIQAGSLRLDRGRLYCSPTTPFSRFRLLPFRSPLLRESLLLSFPLATKMFQFARVVSCCPWIQAAVRKVALFGNLGSMLIFNSRSISSITTPFLVSRVPRYPP